MLNNNLIVTVDRLGRELVLMGRGLGWHLQPHDPIDYGRVEKTYVLDVNADPERVHHVLAEVPFPIVDAVTDAVEQAARELGNQLSRSLPIALIDHVQFVLERLQKGIRLPVVAMPELMILYPEEAAVASRMRDALSTALGFALPPEEAVFLAMHLINALHDRTDGGAALLLRRVNHIVQLIEAELGITLDAASPDYARFVLHIKFLVQRLSLDAMLNGEKTSFYEAALHSYESSFHIARRVQEYVAGTTQQSLSDEEMMYLVIHIERLKRSLLG